MGIDGIPSVESSRDNEITWSQDSDQSRPSYNKKNIQISSLVQKTGT